MGADVGGGGVGGGVGLAGGTGLAGEAGAGGPLLVVVVGLGTCPNRMKKKTSMLGNQEMKWKLVLATHIHIGE